MAPDQISPDSPEAAQVAYRAATFLEGTSDLVTVVDKEGRFTYLNQAAPYFLGDSAENLLGKAAFDFIHPEDRKATLEAFSRWLADKVSSASWENRQVSLSGEIRHTLWTIMPQYDKSGALKEVWSIGRDVTFDKEYAERLKTTIESSIDGYWLVDSKGQLLEVNRAYVEMSGYSRDELLKMRIPDLEARELPEETAKRIERVLKEGHDRFESEHRRKDGSLFVVEVSVSLLPGEDLKMVAFLRDITAKKKAELSATQELSTLKSVFDGIDDVIYVADPQSFELLFVNETFRQHWGDDVLGRKCFEVLQDRSEACPFCTNDKIFGELEGKSYAWEFQNEVNEHWYRCIDRAIDWPDGRKVRFELASDITTIKQNEISLREAKERFERAIEATEDGIWEWNIATGEEYFSPRWCEIIGYSYDDNSFPHTFDAWRSRLHPEDAPAVMAALQAHLERDEPYAVEYRHRHQSGEYRWQRSRGLALRDQHGQPQLMTGAITDITEIKEAELALISQKQQLEEMVAARTADLQRRSLELATIIDAIPGLIFYKDKENRYLRVNQYVADAHHTTKEDLEGKSLFDLYPKAQAQAYHEDDLEVMASGRARLDIVEPWQTENGTRWLSTSKIPYRDAQGEVSGVIGVAMDITARKMAEDAVARSSQVTAGINRIFREALSCETEEALALAALKVAEELTGSGFGFIGQLNDTGKFDTLALSNPGWQACTVNGDNAPRLIVNMELRGIWATVLKTGKGQIINTPDSHPDWHGLPKGHPPLRSFLGVPFIRDGQALGMIALANKAEGYQQEDRQAIELLAAAFYQALLRKRLELKNKAQIRIREAQNDLAQALAGDPDLATLGQRVIAFICQQVTAPAGLLYVQDHQDMLHLRGSFAAPRLADQQHSLRQGEGLVGQAALSASQLVVEDLPDNYFPIASGLGTTKPKIVHLIPIFSHQRVRAVVELALLKPLTAEATALLEAINDTVAAAIESAQARVIQATLLQESQQKTEELQTQQEELRIANEELAEQTQRLRESEARLKDQQEELQVANEELEEKAELLVSQKQQIEMARQATMEQARELEMASKYKSEFLANMSHELRTPLNSLLLLARSLAENKKGNLFDDQVESAQIIYQGGNDLLALINDILDLSKIEAGRMDLHLTEVRVEEIAQAVKAIFKRQAEQKNLAFKVVTAPQSPAVIVTDRRRLEQVLRNLVGNAIKFTDTGQVSVLFDNQQGNRFTITVEDTGIGIAKEHHEDIFNAFRQVDGSTGRKYSGTGLGLSIVRQLLEILGGEVVMASEPGVGSRFSIILPVTQAAAPPTPQPKTEQPVIHREEFALQRPQAKGSTTPAFADDRKSIGVGDQALLIIEDDISFARILAQHCQEHGFKAIACVTGEEGVELARKYLPSGILLDIRLPGISGFKVLEMLKDDPKTRHIPIHIISADEPVPEALRKGAVGYLKKPVTAEQLEQALSTITDASAQRIKHVLVVEDDESTRRGVVDLLSDETVEIDEAPTGAQAMEALLQKSYDCMVLDLTLLDIDGKNLLKQLSEDPAITIPPVIVYTARELSWEEDLELRTYSKAVVVKGVRSDERLLDEVSLFLHRVVAEMPEKKRQIITNLHDANAVLQGKRILLVDDDMRTLFALTRILNEHGIEVLKAENGKKALAVLDTTEADIDLVIMDIMMPVMDGYETMKRIRSQEQFRKLPIVALTAKAMRDDQEKCIAAGANDYLPKPVDQERLLSLLRVWLYR